MHPCTGTEALTGRTAYRGSRGIALLFLDHCTRRGEGSASRLGRSLPLGKTRYPFYRRLGGPQGRSGLVWKISPLPGFDPRTVQPVASRHTVSATPVHLTLNGLLKLIGRNQCCALVYTVRNILSSIKCEYFLDWLTVSV